jgi:DNA-binding Xre family transcriptional regulator
MKAGDLADGEDAVRDSGGNAVGIGDLSGADQSLFRIRRSFYGNFPFSGYFPGMKTRAAYSGLGSILFDRDMSVRDLGELLEKRGTPVSKNTLYRLSKAEPIDRIELQILGALRDALEVSLDDLLIFEAPSKGLQQLSASKQKRLHELMGKNTEGNLATSEREEFLQLGREAERLTLANARQLAAQRKSLQHS